jgi:hypothetical protein
MLQCSSTAISCRALACCWVCPACLGAACLSSNVTLTLSALTKAACAYMYDTHHAPVYIYTCATCDNLQTVHYVEIPAIQAQQQSPSVENTKKKKGKRVTKGSGICGRKLINDKGVEKGDKAFLREARERCTCMHKHRDFTRNTTEHSTSGGRDRPQDPTLKVGHPHTSIPRTATHDRAHSNATMRKHAPQPQNQITKAATADPHILFRGPPETQKTNAMHNELRSNDRTEHNARGTHSSSQHAKGGGGSSVQNSPRSATNPEAPRRGRDPKSRRSPKSSSTGRACEH